MTAQSPRDGTVAATPLSRQIRAKDNCLLLVARCTIYRAKCNNRKPSIELFEHVVKDTEKSERCSAKEKIKFLVCIF